LRKSRLRPQESKETQSVRREAETANPRLCILRMSHETVRKRSPWCGGTLRFRGEVHILKKHFACLKDPRGLPLGTAHGRDRERSAVPLEKKHSLFRGLPVRRSAYVRSVCRSSFGLRRGSGL
jgi:hypothetical protein